MMPRPRRRPPERGRTTAVRPWSAPGRRQARLLAAARLRRLLAAARLRRLLAAAALLLLRCGAAGQDGGDPGSCATPGYSGVCSPGYEPNATAGGACAGCGSGTYKSEVGNSACTACPYGGSSPEASTSATQCVAPTGSASDWQWDLEAGKDSTCVGFPGDYPNNNRCNMKCWGRGWSYARKPSDWTWNGEFG